MCHHCLSTVSPATPGTSVHGSATLCSPGCASAALSSYLGLDLAADLQDLRAHCLRHKERFPLMAARLALLHLADGLRLLCAEGGSHLAAGPGGLCIVPQLRTVAPPTPVEPTLTEPSGHPQQQEADESSAPRECRLQPLCFANIPPPYPPEWAHAHQLLRTALERLPPRLAALNQHHNMQHRNRQAARASAPAAAAVAASLHSRLRALDLEWYVSTLARMHLNSIQVSYAPAAQHKPGSGPGPGSGSGSVVGSAVYLQASLFNHSCDPNTLVGFRSGSTISLRTGRGVRAGEPLCISYADTAWPLVRRQQQLEWAYGFRCRCTKCNEQQAQVDCG